jgi:transcriptional regulator with XRE-family HTH domain
MGNVIPTIRRALKSRGITSRALSSRLGYSGNSFVSNVLTGKKRLPLDRVEDWAEALGMRDRELDDFYLACVLELAPSFVKRLVRDLIRRSDEEED